ncbi:reverse transcriptase [Tanacetum coccineum]
MDGSGGGDGWLSVGIYLASSPYSFVKVNCDVAWLPSSKEAGLCRTEAVWWAVKTAHENHLPRIHVETDSSVLYHSLFIKKPLLQITSLWQDIMDLASTFECCRWTFVKRGGNVVAHSIASSALGNIVSRVVDDLVLLK